MNSPQLDRNEQIGVVLCGIAVVAIILVGMWVYTGPRKAYQRSRDEVTSLVEQLATLETLKAAETERVERLKSLMDTLQSREPNFSLLAHVEKLVKDQNLTNNAEFRSARPGAMRENSAGLDVVTLTLNGVGLKNIVDVLHALYASNKLIIVQGVERLRPSEVSSGLDCTLTLASLKPVA